MPNNPLRSQSGDAPATAPDGPPGRPRIKICCIASVAEARLAIGYGASALGLVSAMPSGPGVIPEAMIAEVAAATPPGVATFLLTRETTTEAIVAQQKRCCTNTLQLCARVEPAVHRELRARLPGIALVQVVHVTGPEAVDQALELAESVDALLLDSGNPSLATPELGGTGRVHDWRLSRRIREQARCPLFLAGGLGPANVAAAIREVGPYGVDLCTGLRTAGRLDEAKLAAFVQAVATAK